MKITTTSIDNLGVTIKKMLTRHGWRLGHMTARNQVDGTLAIEVLLLDTNSGNTEIVVSPLCPDTIEYPSLTACIPSAHWAERAIGDFFGLRAIGHPRWKSLILHNDDDDDIEHYRFMQVQGEGVHEIPVGPIHAGIIEPGHFRFSCLGEIITNLEIRLGYQYRGIERRLTEIPWQQSHYLAESASSDTAAGNALAHAVAIEQMLGIAPPPRASVLRTMSLEIERLANHIGDMGGLSADIGYSAGSAIFARLRGATLGLGEILTGTRMQRWYIVPGGVSSDIDDAAISLLSTSLARIASQVKKFIPLILSHQGVIERMEGTGKLPPELAREFGIVGPAGRASGSSYDARTKFSHGIYPEHAPIPVSRTAGDALARAQIRGDEIMSSLSLLEGMLDTIPQSQISVDIPATLPADCAGIGIVEAWRGELIHWITTDANGHISRYAIKDPSFNNWTGLAIAVRGNLVADFPLCNKSFNLSYSGNDL